MILPLAFISLIFNCFDLLACHFSDESVKKLSYNHLPSKIENATNYHYIRGGIVMVNSEPKKVLPLVFFCSNESILSKVKIPDNKNLDELFAEFDSKMDQSASFPRITTVKIGFHIKLGRAISYHDKDDNSLGGHAYNDGPEDIKNETHPSLIHPYSLLSTVEKVEIDGFLISPLLFSYLEKTITYDKNNQKIEKTTTLHKSIQATKGLLFLSACYLSYRYIHSLIK